MKDVVGRGPPTMSNIAGLFHPWEREPERGGWLTGVGAQGRSGARGCNGGRSADPSASLHPRLSATLIFLHGPRSIIPRHIRPLSSLFPPSGSDTVPWLCFSLFLVSPPTISPAPRPSSHPLPPLPFSSATSIPCQ